MLQAQLVDTDMWEGEQSPPSITATGDQIAPQG